MRISLVSSLSFRPITLLGIQGLIQGSFNCHFKQPIVGLCIYIHIYRPYIYTVYIFTHKVDIFERIYPHISQYIVHTALYYIYPMLFMNLDILFIHIVSHTS